MLFNSYEFIFIFLPIVLFGFHFIGKHCRHRVAIAWLVGASLFFYGWWNPAYLGLLLFSIIFNYSCGTSINNVAEGKISKKIILIIGIIINLSVLGYFKYANFFIDNLNVLTGTNIFLNEVILPLGISFFTFQQITYLVDSYFNETKEYNFLHYCLFVTFFPQLIAGPIVHHKEMLPQYNNDSMYRIHSKNITIGLTIFILGLFKKVVLADGISVYASPVFNAAEIGTQLTLFEAWVGAIAYSFQLYFDFSGYSDMAIGIARMFGVKLPLNFNSPYKATNISDFWRQWHMTLSRLIRDYLWDPISLTLTRHAINNNYNAFEMFSLTIVTPILFSFFWIGLWHGAGWNFIIFGMIHGVYIIIHNIWKTIFVNKTNFRINKTIAWLITFFAVSISWVPFRAESINGAGNILAAMFRLDGISLSGSQLVNLGPGFIWILALLIIATKFPNTIQFMQKFQSHSDDYNYKEINVERSLLGWNLTTLWAIIIGIGFCIAIASISKTSEFLYFQF
jgi:alginate O-acetyltransferase complex protein AlgI